MKKILTLALIFFSISNYAQNDVTFNVDMNCYDTTFTTVYITGPFTNWCGDCYPLTDADADGVWTAIYDFPMGDLEYKYEVDNWVDQEDLVDDMVAGGTCAPVTDFFSYANRQISINGPMTTTDVFGQCNACIIGSGCTNPEAINYDPSASDDDGSCLFNVAFSVDMNCYDSMFTTVYATGPFTSWCGNCYPLADDDLDGIWTANYPFQAGEYEYIYELDDWAAQEDLVEDMVNGGTCAPITDFATYANRSLIVDGAVVTSDSYDSCESCSGDDVPGCTDPIAINYDPMATQNDSTCLYLVEFNVDMTCDSVDFNTVYVTGPFNSWCGDCFPLSDTDLDGVWTGQMESLVQELEYKYAVDNFASQEDLVDDMIAGGECAPITDFSTYANRSISITTNVTTTDYYGTCTPCGTNDGCTDPEAVNYSPEAINDDGSCNYEVSFTVDMACDTVSFNTVFITGPFTNWCGDCYPLSDDDLDGIWEATFVFPLGNLEYKYAVDNFASQENLVDDMVGGASCAPITDYDSYANRLLVVNGVEATMDIYGSCFDCGPLDECPESDAIICDNFDEYSFGPMNGQGAHWSTWSGTLGDTDDGIVTSAQAFSNNKSMLIAEGSVQDVILLLGDQSNGTWTVSWMQFVADSATAYYNIQESEVPGVAWNMEVFFNEDGLAPGVGSIAGIETTFQYPEGVWFEVSQTIDLEEDLLTLVVDGVEVMNDFSYTGNVGSINFFSTDAFNRYYIDDLIFDGMPVSVEELSIDDFSFYPNPSSGMVNINTRIQLDQIIVQDVLGKVITNVNVTGKEQLQLNLTNTPKGVYLITFFADERSISKKLIIE